MDPLTDVRDISRIAYGFMASRALFAALEIDLFTLLSGHPRTVPILASQTGIAANRLVTLLVSLVSVGLLTHCHGPRTGSRDISK
jgi:2-hydroxy-4-(methylsulfanyl)butanoate S-methyltransferase